MIEYSIFNLRDITQTQKGEESRRGKREEEKGKGERKNKEKGKEKEREKIKKFLDP